MFQAFPCFCFSFVTKENTPQVYLFSISLSDSEGEDRRGEVFDYIKVRHFLF
jgi:hypothetical protein